MRGALVAFRALNVLAKSVARHEAIVKERSEAPSRSELNQRRKCIHLMSKRRKFFIGKLFFCANDKDDREKASVFSILGKGKK